MGQSQTRPTQGVPFGAMPPSPRTVCAFRIAEPCQRFCCHHPHFSFPERAMSYSPPYSPSLFKRPDRRTEMFAKTPMEVAVYQLHNFSISFFSSLLGGDVVSVKLDNSASGASVVAIDNKIEQAMDLVKNHLMYAVREEVEILKEQIKELAEKNNQLERENYLLKNLASPEQLEKFQSRIPTDVLLPLDNQSVQMAAEQQHQQQQQTCSHSSGSAV
ncbi:unnamed protein product [Menidia menidia]|uniref:TSC22 domain family protein 3 n=1 Tax=Menidia menidia TaxID=238744 RepID=A0A8S4BMZ4_9TELE|nr:unnamed protein product [Menidia menidia]